MAYVIASASCKTDTPQETQMAIHVRGMAPLLHVFDMPASIHFYRDLLGFAVVQTSGEPADQFGWAMLELNGVQLMLNTAYEGQDRPATPDPHRLSAHADTAIYFGCPDVDAAYAHLYEQGVTVKPPELSGYGFKSLSLFDPDGYRLCFHWPES
jgi:glyoxylase I family protein